MVKRHKPEEIIGKLREAEIVLAQGGTTADACRRIAVTEQTYYRWRKEYGGLKSDQARRMKDLEKENLRLRRAISDLTGDGGHNALTFKPDHLMGADHSLGAPSGFYGN